MSLSEYHPQPQNNSFDNSWTEIISKPNWGKFVFVFVFPYNGLTMFERCELLIFDTYVLYSWWPIVYHSLRDVHHWNHNVQHTLLKYYHSIHNVNKLLLIYQLSLTTVAFRSSFVFICWISLIARCTSFTIRYVIPLQYTLFIVLHRKWCNQTWAPLEMRISFLCDTRNSHQYTEPSLHHRYAIMFTMVLFVLKHLCRKTDVEPRFFIGGSLGYVSTDDCWV